MNIMEMSDSAKRSCSTPSGKVRINSNFATKKKNIQLISVSSPSQLRLLEEKKEALQKAISSMTTHLEIQRQLIFQKKIDSSKKHPRKICVKDVKLRLINLLNQYSKKHFIDKNSSNIDEVLYQISTALSRNAEQKISTEISHDSPTINQIHKRRVKCIISNIFDLNIKKCPTKCPKCSQWETKWNLLENKYRELNEQLVSERDKKCKRDSNIQHHYKEISDKFHFVSTNLRNSFSSIKEVLRNWTIKFVDEKKKLKEEILQHVKTQIFQSIDTPIKSKIVNFKSELLERLNLIDSQYKKVNSKILELFSKYKLQIREWQKKYKIVCNKLKSFVPIINNLKTSLHSIQICPLPISQVIEAFSSYHTSFQKQLQNTTVTL